MSGMQSSSWYKTPTSPQSQQVSFLNHLSCDSSEPPGFLLLHLYWHSAYQTKSHSTQFRYTIPNRQLAQPKEYDRQPSHSHLEKDQTKKNQVRHPSNTRQIRSSPSTSGYTLLSFRTLFQGPSHRAGTLSTGSRSRTIPNPPTHCAARSVSSS